MRQTKRSLNLAAIAALIMVATASLTTAPAAAAPSVPDARAPLQIGDQPGLVPTEQDSLLPPEFRLQPVYFRTTEKPGTIIINTDERFLYLVQGDNRALRYGVGVGRDGFQWSGLLKVSRKAEWPDWRPPADMIQRQPYLPRFMAGGEGNPMGARALYLGDTIYRIHGTNQPQTIGHALSSGCFRMVNADVVDLFERVPVGTKVVVLQRAKL
ncbi:L,D-transpeptidase catalytic domain [Kaistia soli DSM 19436]|uniref:L,D-transpeptidase catalytic domain n=1 Tax=Kaistia soli DSM 19436 TaxID=1122133 RepID=A0A1M5PTR0_9HYPH|nr:L,D-transpeptidase [Kaistia soli]SHH05001.1 L,D-transpeptidase catalytic domain [Kaistia soli DSM 19436]